MHNTLRILTVLLALASAFGSQAQLSATFNWADPASLTPAYSAPTSANRYGEYVSMKTFTDTNSGTTVFIDDSGVDQQSQKARFLYGYLSNAVELRVYPQSHQRWDRNTSTRRTAWDHGTWAHGPPARSMSAASHST